MQIELQKPSRETLDNIISSIDKQMNLEKLNMYEVAWEIYERTYYKYAIKTQEERYLREKYERTVVEKCTEIDKLKEEIKGLEDKLSKNGEKTGSC